MEDKQKDDESTGTKSKPKQHVSALEKYGYLNPKVLREAGYRFDTDDVSVDDNDDSDDVNNDNVDTEAAEDLVKADIDKEEDKTGEDEWVDESDEEEGSIALENSTIADNDEEIEGGIEEPSEETYETEDHEYVDDDYFDGTDPSDQSTIGVWQALSGEGSEEDSDEEMEDEERAERTARRLSKLGQKKDFLIAEYLTVMKHMKKVKKHNIFLEDYLYNLSVRKKIFVEDDKKQTLLASSSRALNKQMRYKKKQAAKIKANFEEFITYRPPIVWSPDAKKGKRKMNKKALQRARLARNLDPRPPDYKKKLDLKIISVRGGKYRRMLRSRTRNWPFTNGQNDPNATLNEPKKLNKMQQEIHYGHSSAPKSRTMVRYFERSEKHNKKLSNSDERYIEDNSRINKTCPEGKCKGGLKSRSVSRFDEGTQRTNVNKRTTITASRKRRTKAFSKSISLASRRLTSRKSALNRQNSTSSERIRIAVRKLNCRNKRKNKATFRELRWTTGTDQRLKGRTYNGNKLHSAEREHLINFVKATQLNESARNKAKKIKARGDAKTVESDWFDAIKRLHLLIIRKNQLEKEHEKTLQQKFVDWGLWEKRSALAVDGLLNLFRAFVLQQYYTRGQLRNFNRDVQEFETLLHESYGNMMTQLLNMYNSRMELIIVQRKLKDTADPNRLQGFSALDYDQLVDENHNLYAKLMIRESRISLQYEKLKNMMKTFVLFRDLRAQAENSVVTAEYKYRVTREDALSKRANATKVMKTFKMKMKYHKNLLLQAALVEKPRLLHDFSTRGSTFEKLENKKRNLAREVHLKERDLRLTHIKIDDIKRRIEEWKIHEFSVKSQVERNAYQPKVKGRLSDMISKTLYKCGNTGNQSRGKGDLSQTSTSAKHKPSGGAQRAWK